MPLPPPVLALNSGSSSLKFGLYRVGAASVETLLSGEAESAGKRRHRFWARDANGKLFARDELSVRSQADLVGRIASLIRERKLPGPAAIGHRVVHGGARLLEHRVIDPAVLRELAAAATFAPLHVPPALAVIRVALKRFPRCPHVACLDTAFHAALPAVSRTLPIAKELRSGGIRRYGFHGISCESILNQLGRDMPRRIVIAHLGNGASVTAVKDGRSIDTSMGLTPTGGIIMGTRPGDLDPGLLIYLMREQRVGIERLEDLLNHRSGLRGISELDKDMRRLHEAARSDPRARLAIEMFCYSVRREIAAMIATVQGLDMLVFTGGIGEHDAKVRRAVCSGLEWAGIALDEARNRTGADPISASDADCVVRVLRSEEEKQIARHAREATAAMPAPGYRDDGTAHEKTRSAKGAARWNTR